MPAASLVHDRLVATVARGWTELDWSALGLLAACDAGCDTGVFSGRPLPPAGSTKVVSARLNSAAMACICRADNPVPSATTASGLPPNCRSVNTSTVTNFTCMLPCNSVVNQKTSIITPTALSNREWQAPSGTHPIIAFAAKLSSVSCQSRALPVQDQWMMLGRIALCAGARCRIIHH